MTSEELQEKLILVMIEKLPVPGLTLFSMTWKPQVTPAGRLLFRLAASAHRTSGKDCGSWATPNAWDCQGSTGGARGKVSERMQNWHPGRPPSAQGSAGEISEDLERRGEKWVNKKTGRVLQTNLATDVKMLAPWPTPLSAPTSEASHGQSSGQYRKKIQECAPWPTPRAEERCQQNSQNKGMALSKAVKDTSGPPPTGSTAGTGSGGQLNPDFTRYLMGFPTEWDD